MPSFLTFTLVNLKHQLLALALEEERYPERRPQIQQVRNAIEKALADAVLRRRAEQEAPKSIKH